MAKPNRRRLRNKRRRLRKKQKRRLPSLEEARVAYNLHFYSDFGWMYNGREEYWS